jgi:hypothetical protein
MIARVLGFRLASFFQFPQTGLNCLESRLLGSLPLTISEISPNDERGLLDVNDQWLRGSPLRSE